MGLYRGDNSVAGYFHLKQSREVLKKAVQDLGSENTALSEEINRLKTSPGYARKVLRDKYHLTDEDEDIVFFAE